MHSPVLIKDAANQLIKALSEIYPDNEAKNIVRYLFEDLLEVYNLDSTNLLPDSDLLLLNDAQNRLLNFEPIQYVTGRADFMGMQLSVDKNVLIPRPETEELVVLIKEDNDKEKELNILDIGTGSGCIAIYLAGITDNWKVTAWDISEKAIELATFNSGVLDIRVKFSIQDVLNKSTIPYDYKYDVIVSNPPYIGLDELHDMDENVLKYEPRTALFAGDDPLLFYRTISELGTKILRNKGKLYFELNPLYALDIEDIVKSFGYSSIEIHKDLEGKKRMLKANWFC